MTAERIILGSAVAGALLTYSGEYAFRFLRARWNTLQAKRAGWQEGSERSHLAVLREMIETQYVECPTGCGGSFGELLCWEIHTNGLTFMWLAEKWGISLPILGELIWDHCNRLEDLPLVNHNYHVK